MEPTLWMRGARAAATPAVLKSAQHKWRCLLRCICRFLALLGPREMSDLSPQSGPKRTLDQVAVTNRDFMSTRPS